MYAQGPPNFDSLVLLKEFIINVSYPWCLPLINNRDLRFTFTHNFIWGWVYTVVAPLLAWIMVILKILYGYDGFVLPILLYCLHRFLIALKYATFTRAEYRRLLHTKNNELINLLQSQAQMLSSWVAVRDDVLDFDIEQTCKALGFNPDESYFTLSTMKEKREFSKWYKECGVKPSNAIERKLNVEKGTYYFRTSVRSVAIAMIRSTKNAEYSRGTNESFNRIVNCAVILASYLHIDDRCSTRNSDTTAVAFFIIYMICQTLLLFLFWPVAGNFLYGAFFDFRRRLDLAVRVRHLIRLTDLDIVSSDEPTNLQAAAAQLQCKVTRYLKERRKKDEIDVAALRRSKETEASTKSSNSSSNGQSSSVSKSRWKVEAVSDYDDDQDGDDDNERRSVMDEDGTLRDSIWANKGIYQDEELPENWEVNVNPDRMRSSIGSIGSGFQANHVTDSMKKESQSCSKTAKAECIKEHRAKGNVPIPPAINMTTLGNLNSWVYTRSIMQNFGSRWATRIDTYLGAFIALNIAIAIWLVVSVLQLYAADDGDGGEQDDSSVLFFLSNGQTIGLLLINLTILCFVLICILVAAGVNSEFRSHGYALSLNSMALEAQLSLKVREHDDRIMSGELVSETDLKEHDLDVYRMRDVRDSCNRMVSFIELSNEVKPVRIMGVAATYGLASTILTALATIATSFIGAISKEQTTK